MSRTVIKKAALGLIAGALVTGCSSKETGFTKNLDLNVIVKGSDPVEVKAEKLAKASEALLSAQGFAYASDVADLALQIDSKNLRAQFVKAVLAPILPQKGIMARIAPLAEKNATFKADYEKAVTDFKKQAPNSTLKSFLFDGTADIQSEAEMQVHVDEVVAGFDTLRRFAKDNKDKELTVLTTDAFYAPMLERSSASCTVFKSKPENYTIECPIKGKELDITLTRADFEAVQAFAAGFQLYAALLNSYDLSGALKVAQAHPPGSPEPTREQVISELLADPKFGELRVQNGFRLVKELGSDAVSGLRWIIANQKSLCPSGTMSPDNRMGHMLDQGICLTAAQKSELPASLAKAESILNGKGLVVEVGSKKTPKQIVPMAVIETPIGNLRSLTPLKYNGCDEVVEVADGSLNGLFPNADLNEILKGESTCRN